MIVKNCLYKFELLDQRIHYLLLRLSHVLGV